MSKLQFSVMRAAFCAGAFVTYFDDAAGLQRDKARAQRLFSAGAYKAVFGLERRIYIYIYIMCCQHHARMRRLSKYEI